jgi:hypothetical protein
MSQYDIVAMCFDADDEHAVVTVLQTLIYDSMLDRQVQRDCGFLPYLR